MADGLSIQQLHPANALEALLVESFLFPLWCNAAHYTLVPSGQKVSILKYLLFKMAEKAQMVQTDHKLT